MSAPYVFPWQPFLYQNIDKKCWYSYNPQHIPIPDVCTVYTALHNITHDGCLPGQVTGVVLLEAGQVYRCSTLWSCNTQTHPVNLLKSCTEDIAFVLYWVLHVIKLQNIIILFSFCNQQIHQQQFLCDFSLITRIKWIKILEIGNHASCFIQITVFINTDITWLKYRYHNSFLVSTLSFLVIHINLMQWFKLNWT